MKNLRKLGASCALISVLAVSSFAGQILTPCPPPDPGQILTPCDPSGPVGQGDVFSSTNPGNLGTPRVVNGETSFAEFAADLLLNFLPLY